MTEPAPARVPRRGVLIGVAATLGAAAGASITLAAESSSSSSSAADGSTPGAPTPGEQLMAEHGVLRRTILIYRALSDQVSAGQPIPAPVLHSAATLIHEFIEGFHEALEETYVFPALQRAGLLPGTVDTLLAQHAAGRRITQDLLAVSSGGTLGRPEERLTARKIDAFVRMYEPHEAREDTVVFPAYRQVTGEHDLAVMAVKFADLQVQQFGPGGFAKAVDQVARLETQLGIADLNQFTPTINL